MVHVIWYAEIGPGSAAGGKEDGLMRIGCEYSHCLFKVCHSGWRGASRLQ